MMGKYDNKIKKDKENKEPFSLERYIDDIKLYEKQRKVLDMLEFLRFLEKERIERMIRLQKNPEIRVRLVKLDTSLDSELLKRLGIGIKPKPRKQTIKPNKMKIEWIE